LAHGTLHVVARLDVEFLEDGQVFEPPFDRQPPPAGRQFDGERLGNEIHGGLFPERISGDAPIDARPGLVVLVVADGEPDRTDIARFPRFGIIEVRDARVWRDHRAVGRCPPLAIGQRRDANHGRDYAARAIADFHGQRSDADLGGHIPQQHNQNDRSGTAYEQR
jgi:hypothetical protein